MLQTYCSNSDFLCMCFWGFLTWEVVSLPGFKSHTLSALIRSCYCSGTWSHGCLCSLALKSSSLHLQSRWFHKLRAWVLLTPVVSLLLLALGSVPSPIKPICLQLSTSWEMSLVKKSIKLIKIWSCVVPSFKAGYLWFLTSFGWVPWGLLHSCVDYLWARNLAVALN